LRERKSDIPLLVEHFFQKYCEENRKFLDASGRSILQFAPEAMQILMDHSWPGNVRELENAVERAVVLASEPIVAIDVLPTTSCRRAAYASGATKADAFRQMPHCLRS